MNNNYPYECAICGKIFDAEKDGIYTCGQDTFSDYICLTCYPKIKEYDNNIRKAFNKYYEILDKLQKDNNNDKDFLP